MGSSDMLMSVEAVLREHWVALLVGGAVLHWTYSSLRKWIARCKNGRKIDLKRAKLQKKLQNLRQELSSSTGVLMTLERETILALDILELQDQLRNGLLDPVAVLQAYQAAALIATEKTNCVVDFLDDSLEQARRLRQEPMERRGLLYGVPISIKECFFVRGYDSTAGLSKFIDCPAQQDGPVIKRLKELGAVPFCLTNIPQTMKTYACSNPIYGLTTHPLSQSRTPGGSSGGEGCLIACGGSILGLGSDIGGSLRIPAHFCGVASIKPTAGRSFQSGGRIGGTGRALLAACSSGFLGASVDAVALAMKALFQDPELLTKMDFEVVPIPWKENVFLSTGRLKIGWYDEDGYFPLTPCCKRAVHEAKLILQGLGHELVYFRPPNLPTFVSMFFDFLLSDGGVTSLELWEGDILDQAIEVNRLMYKTPSLVKRLLLKPLFHLISPTMKDLLLKGLVRSADLWKAYARCTEAIEAVNQAWTELDLDVVLAPGFACPALPCKSPARLIPCVSYTAVYNVMNFPAGSVPVTRVIHQDEEDLIANYPKDQDLLYRLVYEGTLGTEGLPLNVQVIARPWQEEKVLRVMKLIESHRKPM